jgi:murein DD-endopeptidase MepM/ murein hydrolase activator NlpD
VKRGQFLGYAGNSGNSSGPHVHMHVKPVITDTTEGPSEAMP